MTANDEVDATIREVVGLVLGRTVAPDDAVSQDTEPSWDSLKHVEILLAVEDALDIRFDEDELARLTTIENLVDSARRHRAA